MKVGYIFIVRRKRHLDLGLVQSFYIHTFVLQWRHYDFDLHQMNMEIHTIYETIKKLLIYYLHYVHAQYFYYAHEILQ